MATLKDKSWCDEVEDDGKVKSRKSRKQSPPSEGGKRKCESGQPEAEPSSEASKVSEKVPGIQSEIPVVIDKLLAELYSGVSVQKCSKEFRTMLSDSLGTFSMEFHRLQTELEVLKAENNILKRTKLSPSFAAVAATQPKVVPKQRLEKSLKTKRHVVFVSSEEGKSSKEVQRIVTETIKPANEKIRIRAIRSTEKSLIIETESENESRKFLEHSKLKELKVKVELPRKRNPLVILYDVAADYKEEEVLDMIHAQNFEENISKTEFHENCKVRFRTGPRNRSTVHLVMEMSPKIRQLAVNKGRLYVGFSSHSAKDYIVVPRCLKCQDLGHVSKHCRKDKSTCSHCGEEDHSKAECGRKEQAAVCIPCTLRKKKCASTSKDCPTHKLLWERLVEKTDYGC